MSDIVDIKRALAGRAQSIAEMLLPNGKKDGHEWRVGSLGGEPGQSLGVHLTGARAGTWCDFATGETGDLIDLWQHTKGLSLVETLDAARAYLGMERPKAFREKERKTFKRPVKPKLHKPRSKALDYLSEVRNLSAEAIEAYKIGETNQPYKMHDDVIPEGSIVFPFIEPDGNLALVKLREPVDGARPIPTSGDCKRVLFGWQAADLGSRELVIVEGEIDALSMYDYGYPAVSVPFGGGKGAKQQWIENEFDRLEQFETIYLALDDDDEGNVASDVIAARLGRHRCLRVKLPRKDANKCLVDGVKREEIDKAFKQAQSLDPEGLRKSSHYTSEVVRLFWPENGIQPGYHMPYGKVADALRFRPAELTIWQGKTGAGKSQILSDCIVDWVYQGSRVCLASLEMKPAQTLRRMAKQAGGVDRPTEEFIHRTMRWLDGGLLIYDRVGKASVVGMLEVFDYARAKYGCDQFVVDSLMRMGIAGDDYTGQEKAIFELVEWVIKHDVHLHLVAHSRKGSKDQSGPEDSEDIKGGMEIGANAFNILSVWRNRKREEMIGKTEDPEEREELEAQPGVVLNITKQRNGDFEGKCGMWFDQASYRYRSAHDQGFKRNYLPQIEA